MNEYPGICAHRGLSKACPENTLPAFGAAIAVGVDEIEFDLRQTKDGHTVICHDPSIDRTTDGSGKICDLTLSQLKEADAGIYLSEHWKGVKIPTIHEVFENYAGLVKMNIHVYDPGINGRVIKEVKELAEKHHIEKSIYLAGRKDVLPSFVKYAPDLERACLEAQNTPVILEYAQKYNCQRVQFGRKVTDEMIRKSKALGLISNIYYADTPEDAIGFIERGIDVILSNTACKIIDAFRER